MDRFLKHIFTPSALYYVHFGMRDTIIIIKIVSWISNYFGEPNIFIETQHPTQFESYFTDEEDIL